MAKDFYINEGNLVGGQEPQALGTAQKKITASAAVTKGQVVEVSGAWTVAPAADGSAKVCGIALFDADKDAEVVVSTEGFVKLTASGAAITAGDKIVSAGSGEVKKMPALTVADIAADLGAAYVQADANTALNTAVNTAIAAVEAALAALNAKVGIALSSCDADGEVYVKWSL